MRRPGASGPCARGQPSRGLGVPGGLCPLPVSRGAPLTGGRGGTPGPQGSQNLLSRCINSGLGGLAPRRSPC